MPNTSHITKVVTIRLSNAVVDILKRRAENNGMTLSEYLRKHIEWEALRNHKKR